MRAWRLIAGLLWAVAVGLAASHAQAQSGAAGLLLNQPPPFACNFLGPVYSNVTTGRLIAGSNCPALNFARASSGTYFNSSGVLVTAATNVPRIDYPGGALAALLFEPQTLNGVPNNTMVSAVVGSPGTLPTGWQLSASGGLTTSIAALPTINGIACMALGLSGTTSGTSWVLKFNLASSVTALSQYAESFFASLTSGALTNIASVNISNRYSGGVVDIPIALTGAFTRFQGTSQAPSGSTTTGPSIGITFSSGVTIGPLQITLCAPQLEQNTHVTSPILTAGTTATRAADTLTAPYPNGTYTQTVVARTVNPAGTPYTSTVVVTNGLWTFVEPPALVAAGDWDIASIRLTRR